MNKALKIFIPTTMAAAAMAVAGPLTVAAMSSPAEVASGPEFAPVSYSAPAQTEDASAAVVVDVEGSLAVGGATTFGAGTHVVGEDVAPGTYRSSGVDRDCYWERLSGTGGEIEEVISNDIAPNPAVVTIEASDVAFHSGEGCETWYLDGTVPPATPVDNPAPDNTAPPVISPPPVVEQEQVQAAPQAPGNAEGRAPAHQGNAKSNTWSYVGVGADGQPLSASASESISDGNIGISGARASGGNNMHTKSDSHAGPGKASSSSKAVITG